MSRTVSAAAVLLGLSLVLPACAGTSAQSLNPPVRYLQHAQDAAQAHDAAAALAALNDAENAWLTANAAWGNPIVHHERPALREIGAARVSVQQARWRDAQHYIGSAMSNAASPDAG